MGRCSELLTTVNHLDGAIVYLEEHRTLHSMASYESTLNMLKGELSKAAEAYLACLRGPR